MNAKVATGLMAAASLDKEGTLQRLAAFNAQLEAEAAQKRDAALWHRFAKVNPITAAKLAEMWAQEQ